MSLTGFLKKNMVHAEVRRWASRWNARQHNLRNPSADTAYLESGGEFSHGDHADYRDAENRRGFENYVCVSSDEMSKEDFAQAGREANKITRYFQNRGQEVY